MINRLFAVMAMLVALTVSAQRLHVTEARQTIEPMTVAMQRTDFNNEICALVKVQLPIAGTGFEGNLIGDTPFKINEYWVYLTPGTKMLHIKAPGYYPLMADFRELGLGPLAGKTVYYLVVEPETQAGGSAPKVETNYVVMTLTPPTATVRIDGQPVDVVDGSVMSLLKLGTHSYQAEAAGYEPVSGTFQITSAQKTSLNLALKSRKAYLDVASLPGTAILVNGSRRGTEKVRLELSPGLYNVELKRDGFKPHAQTVELKSSEEFRLEFTEFVPVYGVLNVSYRPVGAKIALDGQPLGESPLNLSNVPVGSHKLTIEAAGYTPLNQTINISESTPVVLSGALQKQSEPVSAAQQTQHAATSPAASLSNDKVDIEFDYKPNLTITELIERPLGFLRVKRGSMWDIDETQITEQCNNALSKGLVKTIHWSKKDKKVFYFEYADDGLQLQNEIYLRDCYPKVHKDSTLYQIWYTLKLGVFSVEKNKSQIGKKCETIWRALDSNPDYVPINKKSARQSRGGWSDDDAEKNYYNRRLNIAVAVIWDKLGATVNCWIPEKPLD